MKHRLNRPLFFAACLAFMLSTSAAMVMADVGESSCEGEDACIGNTGEIAERACNGKRACAVNDGNIASDACNGA